MATCLELPAPPHSGCCHLNSRKLFSQAVLWYLCHLALQQLGKLRPHVTKILFCSSTCRTARKISSIFQLIQQSFKIHNIFIACIKWNDHLWEGRLISEIHKEFKISYFQVSCAKQPSLALAEKCGSDRSTHKVIETVA